uniref:Putative polyprotein n=1 Tax=Moniliophthora roreri TaxID=221103 RepID=A0A0W0G6M7_MONRR
MFIPKPKNPTKLQIIVDLRARNDNTKKMASPLLDIQAILNKVAAHKYHTMMDLDGAYEQLRVHSNHVDWTTVTTPDGNLVSLVVQQGDCNTPASFQALMNHIFSSYIRRFMYVYLDDIVMFLNSLAEHMRHIKLIIDILKQEKLYLSKPKLQILAPEIDILGHIVDENGIKMDPNKVDSIANWKPPTSRELLHRFLGACGYLADDVDRLCVSMGHLSPLMGKVPFWWSFTEQCAFEDIKAKIAEGRDFHRVLLNYNEGADPIWLVTNRCATGIGAAIIQGRDWKSSWVAAFYSAKLNNAQQNYAIYEIELLAGLEAMCHYQDMLFWVHFTWVMDHKPLIHLRNQKVLSWQQACWMEKLNKFDFMVQYVPEVDNVLADTLSQIYKADKPGTVVKPNNQLLYGLLNPLEIPSYPWQMIGIDFIRPLPISKDWNGTEFNTIVVITDILTSMVHLVPCQSTYKAKQIAELVFDEVYKRHGLPEHIISDWDKLFTSIFWEQLHELIGTKLKLSSAFHPQTDGATERMNCTMTQCLHQCISSNQRDWVTKLPAIEFAINNATAEATGYTLFFLNYRHIPRSFIWNSVSEVEYLGVRTYLDKLKGAVMKAHNSVIASRVKQVRDANWQRRPSPFVKGDLVYLSTKNLTLPKGLAHKLALKYIGPYKIIKNFNNNTYRLDLPSHLKARGMHDSFYASLLQVHVPNNDQWFPGRQENQVADFGIKNQHKWAVDKIVAHSRNSKHTLFKTHWKSGDQTWLNYKQVVKLDILTDYLDTIGQASVEELSLDIRVCNDEEELISAMINLMTSDETEESNIGESMSFSNSTGFKNSPAKTTPSQPTDIILISYSNTQTPSQPLKMLIPWLNLEHKSYANISGWQIADISQEF